MKGDPNFVGDPDDVSDGDRGSRRWPWLIAAPIVLICLFFIFRYIYFHSAPSQRWPNVGAAATAAATIIAGAGLFFLAIQARDSASAAKMAASQARAQAKSSYLAQQQFNDQLTSARRQQAILIFESITLGQTLEARGRLAEVLKEERPKKSGPLKVSDLPSQARDDLFQIMRRFQLAAIMCLPLAEGTVDVYVDREMAFRLIGWDIAWWYGALQGAFGKSLMKSGHQQSWESLGRLKDWVEKQDRSLATVRNRAEQWIQSPHDPSLFGRNGAYVTMKQEFASFFGQLKASREHAYHIRPVAYSRPRKPLSLVVIGRKGRRACSGPGLWPGPRRQARWAGRGLQGQRRAAGASRTAGCEAPLRLEGPARIMRGVPSRRCDIFTLPARLSAR
jgi:hypothetical protein